MRAEERYLVFGRRLLDRVLVTGGSGFIGCNFLRLMVPERPETEWVNLYALLTAKVISIDPIVNGKHIDRSQLIEVAPQHLCEKRAHA